ncbi:MAG: glycosyltransferase family 2 protein [Cytophagaceae bacterium]|nr:glycosyltransferase family 2 protein [Cytophagaceae bacterium]MDW8457168.1 glycosyltransferase [Cytophagaceae bacterium]
MAKLSVIIVNYNVCHFLEQTLSSMAKAISNIDAEVFVVDNNSVDDSVQMVKSKYGFVKLIENHFNAGFSKANNQAIRIATGEYILLLNPDTIVEEDTFMKCIEFMDAHPEAGALGVKMVDGSGKFLPESKRGLPTPWVAFYKISGLARLFPRSKKFGHYHLGYLDKDQTHPVEILSGAFMFIRKQALDTVGLLDEDFFMYGEDIDLSYRLIIAGYKNYYFADTRIIHYKGESTKRTSLNYVFTFYKAMILFARKHFSDKNAGIFSFLIYTAICLRAALAMLSRFIQHSLLPIADAAFIYAGMYFIKTIWEDNFKAEPGKFPEQLTNIVIPAYILIWMVAVFFNSGYHKSYKPRRIVRGVIMGTIIIAVLTNFIDTYRYSKALILLGCIWASLSMLFTRLVANMIRHRKISIQSTYTKRVAILGSEEESMKIMSMLQQNKYDLHFAGYICNNASERKSTHCLGNTSRLREIVQLHKIDELIFCPKDFSIKEIIGYMMCSYSRSVEFKIAAHESDFIVGSKSKNTQGDYYTLSIQLNILKDEHMYTKRIADIAFSILFLAISPVIIWVIKKPHKFLLNIIKVLIGERSWVGFSENIQMNLPKVKKGVLSPAKQNTDLNLIKQLNFVYARDYDTLMDVKIILSSIRHLGG